jgi:hypothetical protein
MPATRDELIHIVCDLEGCPADQAAERLKAWTNADLIPRGEQVHEAGHEGSFSLYPDRTDDLLLALIERHKYEKRYDELALWLWWDRVPLVQIGKIKDVLSAFAADVATALEQELGASDGDIVAFAERLTVQLVGDTLPGARETDGIEHEDAKEVSPTTKQLARRSDVRAMRKRTTSVGDFLTAVLTLLRLALFGEAGWTNHPMSDRLARLEEEPPSDLVSASPDRITAAMIGAPWVADILPSKLEGAIHRLGVKPGMNLARVLEHVAVQASDDELAQARDLTRSLIESGGQVVATLKVASSDKVTFGLDFLRTLQGIHGEPRGKWWRQRALFVLIMAALVRVLSDDEVASLRASCAAFDQVAPMARSWLETYRNADRPTRTRMRAAYRASLPAGFSDRLPKEG